MKMDSSEHCVCCGEPAEYSLLLVATGDDEFRLTKYNISGQFFTSGGLCFRRGDASHSESVPFCCRCVDFIDGQLRATISLLKEQSKKFGRERIKSTRERLDQLGRGG